MDLKRLKSFVAVAEQGTVSKAAHLLRITQPALSRQIGALEQEIGFKLFARAGRRLALTARGEQLLGRLPQPAVACRDRDASGPSRCAGRHPDAAHRRFCADDRGRLS